jgi:hypothetical protein
MPSSQRRVSASRAILTGLIASAALAGSVHAQQGGNNQGGNNQGGNSQGDDPVVFSFATVGDSRQDPSGAADATTNLRQGAEGAPGEPNLPGTPSLQGVTLPQDVRWTQNTKAITRILRGIQFERPNLLFFNGDMIYGYGRPAIPNFTAIATVPQLMQTDAVWEYLQYAYWRGMVAPLFETGTYVVPVPGNHETQCKKVGPNSGVTCKSKTAYPENEAAFVDNMNDLISDIETNLRFQTVSNFGAVAVNGFTAATAPQAGGNNGLLSNPNGEAELSYSFDIKLNTGYKNELLHFVVINTDPSGADNTAPSDWLAADLESAKTRAAQAGQVPKYFVFGHKPAFTYGYNQVVTAPTPVTPATAATLAGLDANTTNPGAPASITIGGTQVATNGVYRDAFWAVIGHYNATYFCGHEHILNVQRYAALGSANQPYQVIVGAGGSPFDDTLANGNTAEPVNFRNRWDRHYGWATVQVHRSGRVTMTVEGFSDGAVFDPLSGVISAVGAAAPYETLYTADLP